MKLKAFVKAECPNFRFGDECCWFEMDANLTDRMWTPEDPFDRTCPVLLGTRCGRFEKRVIPIANQAGSCADEQTRNRKTIRQERQEAVCEYMDNNYKMPTGNVGCVLTNRRKTRRGCP